MKKAKPEPPSEVKQTTLPGVKQTSASGISASTKSGIREPKIAEAKEDWSEKTHTQWSEHSGFIESTKTGGFSPPPRLDHRTVPRPIAPSRDGLTPQMKNALVAVVLMGGVGAGLYANGVFDKFHRRPKVVIQDVNDIAESPVAITPARAPQAVTAPPGPTPLPVRPRELPQNGPVAPTVPAQPIPSFLPQQPEAPVMPEAAPDVATAPTAPPVVAPPAPPVPQAPKH